MNIYFTEVFIIAWYWKLFCVLAESNVVISVITFEDIWDSQFFFEKEKYCMLKSTKISTAHYYLWYHKPEVQVQVESNVVTSVITFQNVLLKYWIFQTWNFSGWSWRALKKSGFAEPDIFLWLKRNLNFSHQGAD